MHDPQTVAFTIPYPWRKYGRKGRNEFERSYREPFITIWHVDPERDGSDDSCGWFMRARHGDKSVLEKIEKRYEFDWDRIFNSDGTNNVYFCGYFTPDGDPHFSVQGIVLNLFFVAAGVVFQSDGRTNWKKARRFMRRHLFDILMFAENPTDSLFDGITRKFEIGCGEVHTPERRKARIHGMAGCVYAWILRETRPWYRHPRWHIWHWKLQIHPLQTFKRWAFSRCCKCGGRFAWGYCPTTDSWNSEGPQWFRSERNTYHSNCSDPTNYKAQVGASGADSVPSGGNV